MKLWKIAITASPYYQSPPRGYAYTGVATTAEIAIRQMKRRAKKDNLSQIEVETVECLGKKEFGR